MIGEESEAENLALIPHPMWDPSSRSEHQGNPEMSINRSSNSAINLAVPSTTTLAVSPVLNAHILLISGMKRLHIYLALLMRKVPK